MPGRSALSRAQCTKREDTIDRKSTASCLAGQITSAPFAVAPSNGSSSCIPGPEASGTDFSLGWSANYILNGWGKATQLRLSHAGTDFRLYFNGMALGW